MDLTVADHAWRTALLASVIAKLEGADPRDPAADQVAGLPKALADAVQAIVAEYAAQGYENAQRWIDNSRGRIVTKSGQALADAVLKTGSPDWLHAALGEKRGRGSP